MDNYEYMRRSLLASHYENVRLRHMREQQERTRKTIEKFGYDPGCRETYIDPEREIMVITQTYPNGVTKETSIPWKV